MEEKESGKRRRGGRPSKAVKRNQLLGVKCTLIERKIIELKAKETGASVSEYLRELGLHPATGIKKPNVLPKEVLLFTGTLNHLAANINQVAFRRNRGDVFSVVERFEIMQLIQEVKGLAKDIKSYLK